MVGNVKSGVHIATVHLALLDIDSGGGGGGAAQSMNVGNNWVFPPPRLPPYLGFHCSQNWHMYNHRSSFWLIFQNCFPSEVRKGVEIVTLFCGI